ncbi:MAG: CNNM domain-containing protein, partial [Myxococcota bacterium]
AYVTATSVILTLLILIFSEIIPKTIGARYWKSLAIPMARIMGPLIFLTYPLVLLSQGITRLIGGSGHHGPSLSREEFNATVELVSREGLFHEDESRILRNLFLFSDLRAQDVMTPRTVIQAFEESATVKDVLAHERAKRFSRLPVHSGDLDSIQGYVLKQDVLLSSAENRLDTPLKDLVRKIMIVSGTMRLREVLEAMLAQQEHIALLVDEYGGTAGILTMEDLVETLLGLEIVDESDATVDMQQLARRQWERRAERLGLVSNSEVQDEKEDGEEPSVAPGVGA